MSAPVRETAKPKPNAADGEKLSHSSPAINDAGNRHIPVIVWYNPIALALVCFCVISETNGLCSVVTIP